MSFNFVFINFVLYSFIKFFTTFNFIYSHWFLSYSLYKYSVYSLELVLKMTKYRQSKRLRLKNLLKSNKTEKFAINCIMCSYRPPLSTQFEISEHFMTIFTN